MTTYFVNKSGNDSNDGKTPATAKLTIGAAHIAAGYSSANPIQVQSGVYNEGVSCSGNGRSMTLVTDGYVVLDGQGVLTIGVFVNGAGGGAGISSYPLGQTTTDSGGKQGLVIKNFTTYALNTLPGGYFYASGVRMKNCPTGFYGTTNSWVTLRDSLICDMTTGMWSALTGIGEFDVERCTFYNNDTAIAKSASTAKFRVVNCIVHRGSKSPAKLFDFTNTGGNMMVDYNNLRFDGTVTATWGATTGITTLAAWQSASGKDAMSIDTIPAFLDAAKELFALPVSAPQLTAGAGSPPGRQGAFGPAQAISNNVNASLWTGGTFVGTQVNGSGDIELSAPPANGTFESGDLDAGSPVKLGELVLPQNIVYPAQVIDKTTTSIVAHPGTWTWNGTTTVTATDTSQAQVGQWIQMPTDTKAFQILSIIPNTSVAISNPNGYTIPSGSGADIWEPNRLTVEVKGASTQGGLAGATYQEVEIGEKVEDVIPTSYRWWKFKLTLRTDGVAA